MGKKNIVNTKFKRLYEKKTSTFVFADVYQLWIELGILISNVCDTAAETIFNRYTKAKSNYVSWSELKKQIKAHRDKIEQCIRQKNIKHDLYKDSIKIYLISDQREDSITCFKGLIEDLKHTDSKPQRYINLKNSIIDLFNNTNMMLGIFGRIVIEIGQQLHTNKYNIEPITKHDIGITW